MNSPQRARAMWSGGPVDRLPLMPITMMFAADQIGRPYLDYVSDHRVLAEGQLRTAERFGFDQLSAISDPAREAADCGAAVRFFPNQPPAIDEMRALLSDKATLARLALPDVSGGGRMHDRVKGVALLKREAGGDKLVEGWVEGPCAEGADLRGINNLMLDFYDDEPFVADLFEFVIEMELRFARAQVQAGADWIGVGDAAASLVGPEIYRRFVWPAEKRLIDGIHGSGAGVRLHICGNMTPILAEVAKLGCEVVDLDYPVSVARARAEMGPRQALLGNIDPVRVLRNGTAEQVREALAACHREAGQRYFVGAGCEVPRDTPGENLLAMTDYAISHT